MVRALGHPTRLRILDLVEGREVAYPELLRETGVSKANLSQHLGVLRAGHLLTERRHGREVHFRLTYPGIKVLCGAMRQILARHLDRQARVADAGRREVARAGVRRRRQQWRAG
ncbi:MAG TPA: metalloregulator ArsR/SmtB family transcription factor [Methylomirabilota bacterium]|nr:metalloregulator ArsR/SmtB family transcription factor [Methylomirabilota bacterium]